MMHPWMRLLATLAILIAGASIGTARCEVQAGQLQTGGNAKQASDDAATKKQDDPPAVGTVEPTVDAELRTLADAGELLCFGPMRRVR